MKHAANTHAVDLNTGGIFCAMNYVDVVPVESPYVTCFRCRDRLRRAGVDVMNDVVRARLPKVYLVTGLRMVRTGRVMK